MPADPRPARHSRPTVERGKRRALALSVFASVSALGMLSAGCTSASTARPASSLSAPVAAPAPASPLPAEIPPEPASGADQVGLILRVSPMPGSAEMMLFAYNGDGTYRPFYRGEPAIGSDTMISSRDSATTAILFVRAPGYLPQAYEFVFTRIADFFPELRAVPAGGNIAPRGEAEELGSSIQRDLTAGKIVDPAGP